MTQRNPNNSRYQQEKRTGTSRKSASSAKPKSKAAGSVVMGSAKKGKTAEQKKADKKAARAKEREREREYHTPPTEQFKRLKRLWWICLGAAVICVLISWFGRQFLPTQVCTVVLVLAYGFIIAALYLDLGKMRKERRKYAAEMEHAKTKEGRAAAREEKRRAKEAEKKAEEAAADGSAAEEAPKEQEKPKLFKPFGFPGMKTATTLVKKADEQLLKTDEKNGKAKAAKTDAAKGAAEKTEEAAEKAAKTAEVAETAAAEQTATEAAEGKAIDSGSSKKE